MILKALYVNRFNSRVSLEGKNRLHAFLHCGWGFPHRLDNPPKPVHCSIQKQSHFSQIGSPVWSPGHIEIFLFFIHSRLNCIYLSTFIEVKIRLSFIEEIPEVPVLSEPFLKVQEDSFKRGHKQALCIKIHVNYTGFLGTKKIFKIICLQ